MFFLQVPSQDEIAQDLTEKTQAFQQTFSTWWHLLLSDPKAALLELGGYAFREVVLVVVAVLVFLVGKWIIKKLLGLINRIFERRKVDSSVAVFVNSLLKSLFYVILFVIIISIMGWQTTSFVAILAAAAFAIGMALSGTLQNFAGGVVILLNKPYRIGDYIVAQGQEGTVKSIQLFNTILTTADNRTVILPNGPVSTGIIMNTSSQNTRRVEWTFGINYGDDFEKSKIIIKGILDKNEKILRKPDYTIEINQLADSAVNIVVRVWVRAEDYWGVFFSVNQQVYKTLPEKGIQFPFPQMEVHITQ